MIDVSDLIGFGFKEGGRSKEEGFDCYGLAIEIYRRLGFKLPDYFWVEDLVERDERINEWAKQDFIRLENPKPYCIVTFTLRRPYTTHVGVMLENCRRFIHIMPKRNVCIEVLDYMFWEKRVTGYFYPEGFDYDANR